MRAIDTKIRINRAPMLTLWAAVVAERLGFDRFDRSLTLGQAVAGSSAYARGISLGISEPRPELVHERLAEGEQLRVALLGRVVPLVQTPDGLRAVNKGKPCNSARARSVARGTSSDADLDTLIPVTRALLLVASMAATKPAWVPQLPVG